MESTQKIPGDRLVLGMLSAFRTLVWALSKNGAIDTDEYVTALDQHAYFVFGRQSRLTERTTHRVRESSVRRPYLVVVLAPQRWLTRFQV